MQVDMFEKRLSMLLLSEVWCQYGVAVAVLNSDPNGASCRHLSHLIYLSLYCALLAGAGAHSSLVYHL